MEFAIDVRHACRPSRTGKGQWTYGFVSELIARGMPLTLLSDTPLPAAWNVAHVRSFIILSRGILWHWRASRIVRLLSTETTYVSPTSFIVPWILKKRVRCVSVVHDLIAFHGEPHDQRATFIERFLLPRILPHAHRVCTISDTTKNDLLDCFPKFNASRISVIFAGPMRERPEPHSGGQNSIVCIGTLCPRKNQKRLIQAYAALPSPLRDRFTLVLAGSRGWHDQEIVGLAHKTPGVQWHGHVGDAKYEELLTSCVAFALPSLYEGFGMQILDALQRGVPVLTSDRGSLKEVAGGAAVIVNPENVQEIAQGLQRILEDAALRAELMKKGPEQASKFSWKRTVDLFLEQVQ